MMNKTLNELKNIKYDFFKDFDEDDEQKYVFEVSYTKKDNKYTDVYYIKDEVMFFNQLLLINEHIQKDNLKDVKIVIEKF